MAPLESLDIKETENEAEARREINLKKKNIKQRPPPSYEWWQKFHIGPKTPAKGLRAGPVCPAETRAVLEVSEVLMPEQLHSLHFFEALSDGQAGPDPAVTLGQCQVWEHHQEN